MKVDFELALMTGQVITVDEQTTDTMLKLMAAQAVARSRMWNYIMVDDVEEQTKTLGAPRLSDGSRHWVDRLAHAYPESL